MPLLLSASSPLSTLLANPNLGYVRMSALLNYQPFKGIYILSAVGFELARLPLWIVKYVTTYGRQNPAYTFRQAFCVRVFWSFVYHIANIQVHTTLPLAQGSEKERFVVIKPAPKSYYKGPLNSNEDVVPVDIGASWYPAPLTESSNSSSLTVVLHLHGGAFVTGDGRTASTGYAARKLLRYAGATHVFAPQYRISTLPPSKTSNPFPAALQDSLTSYLYLINTLNISPSNIILSGDSAGGNLVASMLRYVVEHGADAEIPTPSAALLWSPWIEPANSTDESLKKNKNYNTDYLSAAFTEWGSRAYAGAAGVSALSSPYIGLKNKPFKTKVPLWVNTGGAECLYFDDVEWAEHMKKEGNDVTLDVEPNVPHDIILMGGTLGYNDQATSMAKRAGEWLKEVRK